MGPALLGVIYAASSNLYQLPYVTAAVFGALGLSLFIFGGKIIKQSSKAWSSDQALKMKKVKARADNIVAYDVMVFLELCCSVSVTKK